MRSKGFSMIEILITLGIIAVLMILIFIVVPKIRTNLNTNEVNDQLTAMSAAISSSFKISKEFSGLDTKKAIVAKFVDSHSVTSSESITNAYNGSIFFGPYPFMVLNPKNGSMETRNNKYMITYTNIPNEDCIKIVGYNLNRFDHIVINGKEPLTLNSSNQSELIDLSMKYCDQEYLEVNIIKPDAHSKRNQVGNVLQFAGK